MYHDHNLLPCLQCHPHSYIRMVQHLIERCLLLQMSRNDCIAALAEHASIRPLVTLTGMWNILPYVLCLHTVSSEFASTVWKELLKENRDFFQAYFHAISPRPFNCRPIHRVSSFRRRKQWK
ncbi:hypothetical protein HHK36_024966 [Tetracentron sinense]|uniref:Uncharacterized protein n=1 Tax=Tetracentron sinense TaxID=13715 RepID=A0A834YLU2_TETSI|nr:hypothetical protein HHK36_024966 [Tetracentron sinense]